MKQLLFFLFLFVSFRISAQTYDTLPTGSKPYGNQLYLTNTGLVVGGTSSSKFRVLGTKQYVDSLIMANSLNFGNGVNKTGNSVALGGAFSSFLIGTSNTGTNFRMSPSSIMHQNFANTAFVSSSLLLGGQAFFGAFKNGTEYHGLNVSPSSILINDAYNKKGLRGFEAFYKNYNPATDSLLYAQYGGVKKLIDSNTASLELSAYATKTGTQTLTNKSLTAPVINTPDITNGTANALTVVNSTINNTPIGTSIPAIGNFTTANATGSSTLELLSHKGQANGYPSLDGSGKVPVSQMPDALVGAVVYQGNYNASNNTPSLPAATGNKGKYYVISTSGTQQGIDFSNGDWIISNGSIWQKVDNSTKVASVNGQTGAVNITDITGSANSIFDGDNKIRFNWGDDGLSLIVDGTNFGPNIPTNINGNAGTATVWGNKTANFDARVNSLGAIPVFDDAAFGQARYALAPEVKSWLGINDGSALSNIASSATYWGGRTAQFGTGIGTVTGIAAVNEAGVMKEANAVKVKDYLGTSLQDVTTVNNVTNNAVVSGNGTVSNALSYSLGSDNKGLIGTLSNHPLAVMTNGAERLRILSNGSMGIGTAGPEAKLHINGSFIVKEEAQGTAYFRVAQSSVDTYLQAGSGPAGADDASVIFSGVGGIRPKMIVKGDGNVGIGTQTPSEKLEVIGNMKASGLAGLNDSPVLADASGVLKRGSLPGYSLLNSDNTYSGNQTYNNGTLYVNSSDGSAIFNDATLIIKNNNVKTFSSIGQGIATFGLTGQTAQTSINNNRLMVTESNGNTTEYLGGAVKKTVSGTAYTSTFPNDNGTVALTKQFESGTYTPTVTAISNVTSPSSAIAHYLRIGKEVTVYGQVSGSFTNGTASNASISVSLPLASNLTALEDVSGNGSGALTSYPATVSVLGDPTNDWAVVVVGGFPAQSNTIRFSFTYTIK